MKVLNLYAGIGGNRKLWKDVDVTGVENNPDIAKVYSAFFPEDTVLVTDAHQYLLDKFEEGLKIDIYPFFQIDNLSVHIDKVPIFIQRNN